MIEIDELFTQKLTKANCQRVADILKQGTSEEVAKIKGENYGIKGDSPVTLHCGGREEHWQSRFLAYHFYTDAAMCTMGSESERYWNIVTGIALGDPIPSDGMEIRDRTSAKC